MLIVRTEIKNLAGTDPVCPTVVSYCCFPVAQPAASERSTGGEQKQLKCKLRRMRARSSPCWGFRKYNREQGGRVVESEQSCINDWATVRGHVRRHWSRANEHAHTRTSYTQLCPMWCVRSAGDLSVTSKCSFCWKIAFKEMLRLKRSWGYA